MFNGLLNFSFKEIAIGILLSVLLLGGGVASIVAFVPRSAGGEVAPPTPPISPPPVIAETATVTVPPVVVPPAVAETVTVSVPAEPVMAQPVYLPLGLSARTGGVIYSANNGTILPLGGFVSDNSNLYADGYANLDKIGFVHSDNPNVSVADGSVRYSATGTADETVTITVGSAVGGVTKEVAISYRVVGSDMSLDSLVDSTIAELDVADEYKVALRELPQELNPFYVNGVSNVSIGNIEEAAAVFDRVKNSDKFGWRELSADEQRKLERGVVALTGVVHFNEQILDYSRDDVNRVLHDLDIWTDIGFFTREFEPAWELFGESMTCSHGNRVVIFSSLLDENRSPGFNPGWCLNGNIYVLSDKGEEYYKIVHTNSDFYWSRLIEHFGTLSVINSNSGTVQNIKNLADIRFDMLFDNYLVNKTSSGNATGTGWGYGKLSSVNERTLESGLVVNSYNALRNVLVYERNTSLVSLNDIQATHELLEWLIITNNHKLGEPAINEYNFPGVNAYINREEEIETLVNASPNYFSWTNSVNFVIPKNHGGVYAVDSKSTGGAVPSLSRLLGITAEQVGAIDAFPDSNLRSNFIRYDFSDLGVKWSDGNLTVGRKSFGAYDYEFACQAIVDSENLTRSDTRRDFTTSINENPVCEYLNIRS